VSKESKIKKRLERDNQSNILQEKAAPQTAPKVNLTPEERARILRDRIANRPVIVFRYPNGRLNKRFIYTLAFMIVILIAAIIIISK
jgi:hypothetical protein